MVTVIVRVCYKLSYRVTVSKSPRMKIDANRVLPLGRQSMPSDCIECIDLRIPKGCSNLLGV